MQHKQQTTQISNKRNTQKHTTLPAHQRKNIGTPARHQTHKKLRMNNTHTKKEHNQHNRKLQRNKQTTQRNKTTTSYNTNTNCNKTAINTYTTNYNEGNKTRQQK